MVRDPALAGLAGRYVFGDYCRPRAASAALAARPAQQGDRSHGLKVSALSSFGEDAQGRVYVTSRRRAGLPARAALSARVPALADFDVRACGRQPSAFTLTGTNTWIVGRDPAWVSIPGPAIDAHVDAVAAEVAARGGAGGIALTHDHSDHAEGAGRAARARSAPAGRGVPRPGGRRARRRRRVRAADVLAGARPRRRPPRLRRRARRFTGDAVLGEGSVFVAPGPGGLRGVPRRRCGACASCRSRCSAPATARRCGRSRTGGSTSTSRHRLERERRLLAALDAGADGRRRAARRRLGRRARRAAPGRRGHARARTSRSCARRAGCRPASRSRRCRLGGRGLSAKLSARLTLSVSRAAAPTPASARRRRASSIAAASGVAPAASASSKIVRSVSPIARTRASRALGRVALGLELDRDVDDPAGVGDEVRRPQDAAGGEQRRRARRRRAGCSPRRRSPGSAARGRVSWSSTPPSAHGARTSTSAVSAAAGSTQRRAELRRPARACAGRRRRRRARAPPSAQQPREARRRRGRARSPRRCGPSQDVGAERALAGRRAARPRTPSAVHGLGSPEPPRSPRSPVTCRVRLGDHRPCRGSDVPTSSAVR